MRIDVFVKFTKMSNLKNVVRSFEGASAPAKTHTIAKMKTTKSILKQTSHGLVCAMAIPAILAGLASAAQAAIIINGFSTEVPAALSNGFIDGDWHDRSNNPWSMTSGSSGVLTHSPASPYDANDEALIGRIVDLSAFAGNSVTLSFDYNVGTGNTLYAHLRAVDSATTAWSINTGAQNGNAWDTNTGGTTYNLFDGLTLALSGDTNNGGANEAASFTGSGNYSNTIDLSGYTISDLGDYKWLMLGFGANATTDNVSTVSNLSLNVIPEPSSSGLLLGYALAGLLFRRKRG